MIELMTIVVCIIGLATIVVCFLIAALFFWVCWLIDEFGVLEDIGEAGLVIVGAVTFAIMILAIYGY